MNMRKYKALLGWLLSASVLAVCLSPQARSFFSLPPLVRVTEGVDFSLPLQLPFGFDLSLDETGLFKVNGADVGPLVRRFALTEPLSFRPLRPGSAEMTLSLFGLPIRRLSLQVMPELHRRVGKQGYVWAIKSRL